VLIDAFCLNTELNTSPGLMVPTLHQNSCISTLEYTKCMQYNASNVKLREHTMPSLQIRDLPEDIYEALSLRAASEHRSLTQQALADLTQVVKSRQTDVRKKLLASIRRDISNKELAEGLLPENLIREDRSR
jgi:plasmid stability protein